MSCMLSSLSDMSLWNCYQSALCKEGAEFISQVLCYWLFCCHVRKRARTSQMKIRENI